MTATFDQQSAKLVLEDGTIFQGMAFGASGTHSQVTGEVVFNTALSGYQEVLSDPSYAGQIVTMTYPHIGSYGINPEDMESSKGQVAGFVVRDLIDQPSNYRSTQSLNDWLVEQGIMGISQIDTRALTKKLRTAGAMRGIISHDPTASDADLVAQANQSPEMAGQNLAKVVGRTEVETWKTPLSPWTPILSDPPKTDPYHVVALDCGLKSNIARHLTELGCRVTILPHNTAPEAILEHQPNGLFVSNGPGDPEPVADTIATLQALHGKLPMFGICLGHQLLGLSLGARTFKLKFGHRGSNHPVQNLGTGKVELTSQNHGFAVNLDDLEKAGATATHKNLNDQTLEGFHHRELPIFAVQYHPEASPGPHDGTYLFDCFVQMMATGQTPTAETLHEAQHRRHTETHIA